MKRELSGLKSDMASLMALARSTSTELASLSRSTSAELASLARSTSAELASLTVLSRNTAIALAKLSGDVSDMKRDMATKDDVSVLMKRMDGFADMLQDSRWDWGKQKVRLDEHEKRISSLEAKRA